MPAEKAQTSLPLKPQSPLAYCDTHCMDVDNETDQIPLDASTSAWRRAKRSVTHMRKVPKSLYLSFFVEDRLI